ncbi:MAG: hypothetical protein OXH00_01075 [Candidatus Poribacteria bacterium]|nr:hypothetical protein [Candidatus Poribacteria bacterium]
MNTYKQEARTGLFHLKESVLDILLEAKNEENSYRQPNAIRKRSGIPKIEEPNAHANTLIYGVLLHLGAEKRVEYKKGYGWRITDQEALLRSE